MLVKIYIITQRILLDGYMYKMGLHRDFFKRVKEYLGHVVFEILSGLQCQIQTTETAIIKQLGIIRLVLLG